MTPEDVIKKIAEIANDVAWQAGVGGLEMAGQFVSVLAAPANAGPDGSPQTTTVES